MTTTIATAGRCGLLTLLVAELAACGGGGGGSAPPPAPPAATVQSFTPADAATQVDVQSTLKIAFDKALEPASVTRAHVTLVAQGVPVATKVTYDEATHSVLVDPMGLGYGLHYTLTMSGLVDGNGQTVASRHAAFSTWVNGETSGVVLRFNIPTGAFRQAQVDTFDVNGAPTGNYLSNDAGADGLWGTADDVIFGGYVTDTFTSDGQLITETGFGGGPDGLWHTADDTPTPAVTRTFLPNGALATEDRINISVPNIYGFEAEGYTTYQYDTDGTLKAAITAVRKGADGVWGTADDIIGWSVTYTYDEFGRVLQERDADLPGADGVWGTADDVAYTHVQHVYLPSGRLDRLEYYDRGIDGTAATDNVLEEVDTYSYDVSNNNVKLVYAAPGDMGGMYAVIAYDAHHNRQSRQYFDDAGADGIWFDGDDRRAIWRTYDTTR